MTSDTEMSRWRAGVELGTYEALGLSSSVTNKQQTSNQNLPSSHSSEAREKFKAVRAEL